MVVRRGERKGEGWRRIWEEGSEVTRAVGGGTMVGNL